MADPDTFGCSLGDLRTWASWSAILAAAFGEPMSSEQQQTFTTVAGGRAPPTKRVRELWCAVGRGGGKSRMASLIAAYLGVCVTYSDQLAPGEVGLIVVIAPTLAQAKICHGYILGFLQQSPVYCSQITSIDKSKGKDCSIELNGNIRIEVRAANFRTTRGPSLLACIVDEISFLRDELSAVPDVELVRSVTPSLVRTGGMLIAISSPYRKSGIM